MTDEARLFRRAAVPVAAAIVGLEPHQTPTRFVGVEVGVADLTRRPPHTTTVPLAPGDPTALRTLQAALLQSELCNPPPYPRSDSVAEEPSRPQIVDRRPERQDALGRRGAGETHCARRVAMVRGGLEQQRSQLSFGETLDHTLDRFFRRSTLASHGADRSVAHRSHRRREQRVGAAISVREFDG